MKGQNLPDYHIEKDGVSYRGGRESLIGKTKLNQRAQGGPNSDDERESQDQLKERVTLT